MKEEKQYVQISNRKLLGKRIKLNLFFKYELLFLIFQ